MASDDINQIAANLGPLIEGEKCVAWIGSGLSIPAGYPGWIKTIAALCIECGIDCLTESDNNDPEKLIQKAEECKTKDTESYHRTLARLFGKPIVETRRAYQLLLKLPFKAYVTTNFDPLLSDAAALADNEDLYVYPDLNIAKLEADLKPLFYIHGLARIDGVPKGDNLVLTGSEFEAAYGGILNSFLNQLFMFNRILFIGCSLEEPAIFETFKRVLEIQPELERIHPGIVLPRRAILLPAEQIIERAEPEQKLERDLRENNETDRFDAMGIDVVRYIPQEKGVHYEVEQIFELLLERLGTPVSSRPKISIN